MNQISNTVVKQVGINLASTALTALIASAFKYASERYSERKTIKRLEAALAES